MSLAVGTICASLAPLASLTNSYSAPVANGAELSTAVYKKKGTRKGNHGSR